MTLGYRAENPRISLYYQVHCNDKYVQGGLKVVTPTLRLIVASLLTSWISFLLIRVPFIIQVFISQQHLSACIEFLLEAELFHRLD